MKNQTLADQLAKHIVRNRTMGKELMAWMNLLLLDYLAVTAGGAEKESAVAARAAIATSGERTVHTPAALHGTDRFASVADAALVNGITAHGLEMDDTYEEASLHPAVVVFPAVLAVADAQGQPVQRVLAAATAGYDVMCAVGTLLGAAAAYGRGFHPTGVAGALGSAAAVAALLELDESRTAHALGLAANMASGSLEFLSDGSWTKRLNAGSAAASGMRAAQLAAAGFTGPATALEGRDGFLRQYGDGFVEGQELRLEFGRGAWDTSIKFYPCCRYMHGNIDLLNDIHRERPGLQIDDVTSIRVGVIRAGATLVSEPPERKLVITTPVDAQFSMPFGAAVALVTGRATVDLFDAAPTVAQQLAPWMLKVECYTSERLEDAFPTRWQAEVTVHLANGEVIERFTKAFRGSPQDRATFDDITTKASEFLGSAAASSLADSVKGIRPNQPWVGQVQIPGPKASHRRVITL